jgi:4-amino-4-deoxy-L-arabinose transferase-like glycosyltransferase
VPVPPNSPVVAGKTGPVDNRPVMDFWFLVAGILLIALSLKVWRKRQGLDVAGASVPEGQTGSVVAVLLGGGLAVALLGLSTYQARAGNVPGLLYPLIGLGIAGFVLAGHSALRGRFPADRVALWQKATAWLGVQPSQMLLLLLALPLSLLSYLAGGDRLVAWDPGAAVIAWSLAIAAVLAGGYRRDEWAAVPAWEVAVAVGLASGAFLLRGLNLEQLPPTLSGDEASAGLEAVRFVRGEANNLFGLGWFSFPAFYFALQSGAIHLFGQTATALRITSAIGGSLTVFVVYWLARALFGRYAAMIAGTFLLASHYHIHFSRIGLQNIWDGLFVAIVLWGIWSGWTEGRRLPFLIAGVALGLGHYFYVSMRIVPLLLLVWAGFAFVIQRARLRERLPGLTLAAYSAAVVYLPLGLLFWRLPDEFFAPLRRVSVFNGWLEAEVVRLGEPAWQIIASQMKATALGIIHVPLRHWYNPGAPLLLPLAAALFIAGLAWLIYSADLRSMLLLLVLGAIVILGGFSLDAPASQRYAIVMPVIALIVALPLAQGLDWLAPYWDRWRWVPPTVAFLSLALVIQRDLTYYFAEVYDSYVLGGYNTETATGIARYLEAEPAHTVYFFGPPRMGYASFSTIPYLAPQMAGHDVEAPLAGPAPWVLEQPTYFIFLPEREGELSYVRAAYPGGRYETVPGARSGTGPLFSVYQVIP